MIRPAPWRFITAAAARIVCITPFRFTSSTVSQSSRRTVSRVWPPSTRKPGHRGQARVRERDVHAPLGGDDVVEQRLHLRLVPDVGDERPRVPAALDELLRGRLEPRLVDVGERHVRAAVRQHLGHREAEPARGAGHHDAGAADVEEAAERLGGAVRHGASTLTTAFMTSAGCSIA